MHSSSLVVTVLTDTSQSLVCVVDEGRTVLGLLGWYVLRLLRLRYSGIAVQVVLVSPQVQ